ncbi:Cytochrome P450 [Macrophomina phaseolina MS6]|uniref:Cytochrome P450 n=1 Tax=Macrophomina phaseolina (strain MS6) TaxID=1126212 RepID=K2R713_MACPH|nr:Cytochrome P450 [Macrophomina phaseolina MS6]
MSYPATPIAVLLTCTITYLIFRVVYDLFFHPLRKIPGPKIAAIGSFYEFYYDVIKDGTYIWEIQKMHQKYVYAGGSRRINKDTSAVRGYTFPGATIATIDHDLHRKRRAILNPYFSKRAVAGLEPIINERLDVLCSRVREIAAGGTAIDLTSAFSAFTADVGTKYFYGSHQDYLNTEDFHFDLKVALTALFDFYHLTRFLPVPGTTIKNIPLPILRKINKNLSVVMDVRQMNKANMEKSLQKEKETNTKCKSVIVSALADPAVPAIEKTMDRMLDEGETIIFAGIDTTARSLSVAFFHLLTDKRHIEMMREELNTLPKPTERMWTTADLECLPYLVSRSSSHRFQCFTIY